MNVLAIDVMITPNWAVVGLSATGVPNVVAFGIALSPHHLHSVIVEQMEENPFNAFAHPIMPKRPVDGTNYLHPFLPSSPRNEFGFEVSSMIAGVIEAESVRMSIPICYVSVNDVSRIVMSSTYTEAVKVHFPEFKGDSTQAFIALVGFLAARQMIASFLDRE